ncbi:MAG: hypothetical protein WDN01_13060 [Rhizomicrobium sp.]
MQLSAANLLIASQQIARGAQRVAPEAQAKFASALAHENGAEAADFAPMDFKQTAPAKAAPSAPAQGAAGGYNSSGRPGANLDIRV